MIEISETLAQAVAAHQAGNLPRAEQLYRQILQADPHQADAWHLLGLIAHQVGQPSMALQYIDRAISLNPSAASFHFHLGQVHLVLGQIDEAIVCYQRAMALQPTIADDSCNLAIDIGNFLQSRGKPDDAADWFRRAIASKPDSTAAHYNLGNTLRELGMLDDAAACLRRAIELNPDLHEAYNNLAGVLQSQGNFAEAIRLYRKAIATRPNFAEAHYNLGHTYHQQGDLDEAIAWYRRTAAINPDYVEAYYNQGHALQRQSRLDEAVEVYRKALQLRPEDAGSHCNLGAALQHLGKLDEAIAHYRRALELRPDSAETENNLAVAMQEQGMLDEALVHSRRAVELKPDMADAQLTMAVVLAAHGRTKEAIAGFDRALQLKPNPQVRYRRATCLPVICMSSEHIQQVRARFLQEVQLLEHQGVRFNPRSDVLNPAFYLTYHGLNDRPMHEAAARLWTVEPNAFVPKPRSATTSDQRIRVGFVSRFFKGHTIGQMWKGVIAQLDREKFHVSVFSLGQANDDTAAYIREHADDYHSLSLQVPAIAQTIADAGLDVLYYPEIGMDPVTYALAQFRLAPVQCVSWGHPVTTGLSTIDYYLSSELLESPDADEHYTEKLLRFKTLGLYVDRPQVPSCQKVRADFGLSPDQHLYACLQSIFKIHPDFDSLLAAILRRDPQGILIIPSGECTHWNDHWRELLLERFQRSMPDVIDRLHWLPWQPHENYLQLTMLVDSLLVPPQFGGGKTSYEALALGAPLVTMPSPYLRGRITHGLYRAIDVLDCVANTADEYVDLAVRLACDKAFHQSVRNKILAANDRLFADLAAVRELEQFLTSVVNKRLPNFPLPSPKSSGESGRE